MGRVQSGGRGVNRRQIVGGAAGAALAGFAGRAAGVRAQATPTGATPAADAFPVTIVHALGETTISAPPQRIALTNAFEALDSLLALGVTPIAVGEANYGGYIGDLAPWAIEAGARGLTYVSLGADDTMDVEALVAAKPDLIFAAWIDEPTYELLSGIAPTIVYKNSDDTTWQDIQRMVGVATGFSEAAEAVVADVEAEIETELARLTPALDKPVAVAYFWFDQFFVNTETAPIGRTLAQGGMTVVTPDAPVEGGIAMLSLEQVHAVEDAKILIAPDFIAEQTAQQEANALFRSLPAVRDGGYIVLSPAMAQAIYLESALGMRWAAPQLVDAVLDGAAGKGKKLDD